MMPEEREKRAKILRISAEVILEMIKPGLNCIECVGNPLPRDCKITGVQTDYHHPNEITLRIESEEFEVVSSGNALPLANTPLFRRVEPVIEWKPLIREGD